jgi:methylsterol monooxygenase
MSGLATIFLAVVAANAALLGASLLSVRSAQEERSEFFARLPALGRNILSFHGVAFAVLAATRGVLWLDRPSAATGVVLAEVVLLFVVDDLFFAVWHRAMHWSATLYARVHSVHHAVRSPTPLDYFYVHPIETAVAYLSTAAVVLALAPVDYRVIALYGVLRTLGEGLVHASHASGLSRTRLVAVHVAHHQGSPSGFATFLLAGDRWLTPGAP